MNALIHITRELLSLDYTFEGKRRIEAQHSA